MEDELFFLQEFSDREYFANALNMYIKLKMGERKRKWEAVEDEADNAKVDIDSRWSHQKVLDIPKIYFRLHNGSIYCVYCVHNLLIPSSKEESDAK